ncbi:hypothetical protein [Parafrigoribacterium soli]|uniref:hypothetical protein n=1 Tax=Parafrigoribacterium soli TaxID=3144663 RepID=UPI0032EC19AF
MSAELERRYRRALAWYPRAWREKNADVVAGTLLDVADAEHRTHPRVGELANLAVSGIATRLGLLLEPRARDAIATIALATAAAYPLAYFAFQLWSPLSTAHAPDATAWGFNPLLNPGLLLAGLWLVALVLASIGAPRRRVLMPTIALAILASISLMVIYRIPGSGNGWYGLTTTTMLFLALLGALALIGTPARGVRLLIPTGIVFVAISSGYLATQLVLQRLYFDELYFWHNISGALALLLAVAVIALIALGLRHRRAAAQTIAISAAPWLLVLLRFSGSQDLWTALGLLTIAAALVGLGALLPLVFRRKPNQHPAETHQR